MGGPSDGGGGAAGTSTSTTRLKFHDTDLELSGALPDVQVEASGTMVLRFANYTGTVTLRPSSSSAAAAAPASAADGSKGKSKGTSAKQEDLLLAELDEELGAEAEEEGKENAGPGPQQQEHEPEPEPAAAAATAAGVGGKRKKQQQLGAQQAGGGGKRSASGAAGGKKAAATAAAASAEKAPTAPAAAVAAAAATTTTPTKGSGGKGSKGQGEQDGGNGAGSAGSASAGGSARKRARRGEGGGGNSTNHFLASPAPSTATTAASRPSTASSAAASSAAASAALAPASPAPTRGSGPQGRWGHSATVVGEGRMVVYGGEGDDPASGAACTFGDLFVFELDADGKGGKWERPLNCDSIPRCWHSATFLPGKNLLVAFGGERMGEGGVPEVLDDIMALDTELFLWYPPAISGKPPTARSGHTASLVGKDIVIFGGSRGRKWCVNTVQCLDVERWSWRSPSIYGNGPPGRSYHSATVVGGAGGGGQGSGGNKVVYFGGNDGDRCYNRVHVLQVGGIPGGPKDWEWFHPEVVGPAPAPRTGHAACLLGDGKTILVQGGWDPQGDETLMYEDAFLLDTEQWEWTGPLAPAEAQALLDQTSSTNNGNGNDNQQEQQEQEQQAPPLPGLLRGGPLHPHPGFLVGHTAVLAASVKGSKAEEGEGKEGGVGGKVLVFGGQDRLGARKEDLLVLEG